MFHPASRRSLGKPTAVILMSLSLASSAALAQENAEGTAAEPPAIAPILMNVFNTIKSFLGGATGELRDLVEKGELDRAYEVYVSRQAELDASADAQPIVAKLAEGWNQRAAPQLAALSAQLRTIDPAAGPAQWAEWSRLMAQAGDVQEKNKANPLLAKLPSAEAAELQSAWNDAQQRLAKAMPAQFLAYDLAAQPDFFAVYPLSLTETDKQRLVTEQAPAVAQALSSYGTARATQALKNYLPLAGAPTARQQWMQGWVNAYAREKQWSNGMTLAQKMEAGRRLKEVIPDADVQATVALLPVFGPDTAPERRAHARRRAETLAQRLGADLQPETEYAQAMTQVAALRSRYNLIVLADVGRLQGIESVVGKSVQQGRFLARNDVRPNPELQRLTQELAQAQSNLARAEMEQKRSEEQAKNMARQSQGMGFLGLVSASVSIFDASGARQEVERLQYELNKAPATISTPVYENYDRQVVTRRLTAVAPVSLYVVDTGRGMVRSSTHPLIQQLEYVVYDNPHPADPDAKKQAAPEQEKRARRDELIQRALTSLPDDVPALDKLVESTQAGMVPIERLPQLMTEEQARFRKEAERHKVGMN